MTRIMILWSGIFLILTGGAFAEDLTVLKPGTRIRVGYLDPSSDGDQTRVAIGTYLGQMEIWKHLGHSEEAITLETSVGEPPLTILKKIFPRGKWVI